MGRPAKALSGFNRTVGSNPTLSAKRVRHARLVVAAIGLAVMLLPTSSVRATCVPNHVVERGESWWSISRSEGVSLRALLKLNGAEASTLIRPRDEICVPKSALPETVQYTQAEVIQIIRDVWPDDLEDRAIAIAQRESKLRPGVIGIPNRCCYGLFQIYYRWHQSWLPNIGVNHARQLLDPQVNARAALEIYRRNSGWGPWE